MSYRRLVRRRLLLAVLLGPPAVALGCWRAVAAGLFGFEPGLLIVAASVVGLLLLVIASFAEELAHADAVREEADRVRGSLSAIVESSDDAIVGRALDGTVTSWNRGAERMYGYSAEEAAGQPLEELHASERPDELRSIFERVTHGESVEHFDTVRVRKDGRRIDVSISISPIRDGRGKIVGASFITRDVTHRHRIEDERAEALAELRRSNEELEHFAYVASHDLSEPLRVIGGFISLLQRRYDGRLDADADRFIDSAVGGVTRMQAMIDALLAYSRVGRGLVDPAPVDTRRAVDEALGALRAQIEAKGAEIRIGPMPTVEGDATLLGQVLQNLISNAVKFSGGGSPLVEISAERQGEGGWTLSVRDNGPGVDPKHADRVFEMFQRLHGREVPGLGIGLSMCKRIVDRHGGRIWVDPAAGGGSAFRFTLPGQGATEDVR